MVAWFRDRCPKETPRNEAVLVAVELLTVGRLLDAFNPTTGTWRCFLIAVMAVPARLLIVGRTLTWAELIGAMIALASRKAWRTAPPFVIACLLCAAVLLKGLSPAGGIQAAPGFQWVPFAPLISANWDLATAVLLRKAFWYGSAVWLLRAAGVRFRIAGGVVAALLGGVEWAQTYIPGHVPEISDPLVALLMAFTLAAMERNEAASPVRFQVPEQNQANAQQQ